MPPTTPMPPRADRPPPGVRLRDLPAADAVRVFWWSLGVTPTARVRHRRFQQSVRDGRGREESLRIARSSGA